MDDDTPSEQIHSRLQEVPPSDFPEAVLTRWSLVAEWVDGTGERWLSRVCSPTSKEWDAKGLMHEALYGDWGDG